MFNGLYNFYLIVDGPSVPQSIIYSTPHHCLHAIHWLLIYGSTNFVIHYLHPWSAL